MSALSLRIPPFCGGCVLRRNVDRNLVARRAVGFAKGTLIATLHVGVVLLTLFITIDRARAADGDSQRVTKSEFDEQMIELALTPTPRLAAEALFAAYSREFEDAWDTNNRLGDWIVFPNEEWYGGQPTEAFSKVITRDLTAVKQGWETGWRQIEASYFDKLRGIAIGDGDKVESLQRRHLRERMLKRWWSTDPEHPPADMIEVASGLPPAMQFDPGVQHVLAEYDLQMDARLRELDEDQRTRRKRVNDAFAYSRSALAAGAEPARANAPVALVFRDLDQHTYAVSELNDLTERRLRDAIPAEAQGDFDDATARFVYPRLVVKGSPAADDVLAGALRRSDLSKDQRELLHHLRDAHRAARTVAIDVLVKNNRDRFAYGQDTDETIALLSKDPAVRKPAWERYDAKEQQWKAAEDVWQACCAKTIAQVEAILATKPAEAAK